MPGSGNVRKQHLMGVRGEGGGGGGDKINIKSNLNKIISVRQAVPYTFRL